MLTPCGTVLVYCGKHSIKTQTTKTKTMAGKPKQMSQIKQLLRLHQQGESKKSIARIFKYLTEQV